MTLLDNTVLTIFIHNYKGICSFLSYHTKSLQLLLSESADFNDPMGVATLTVERSTGFVGEVVVYWEIEDDGVDDIQPADGNLTFADVSQSYNNVVSDYLTLDHLWAYSQLFQTITKLGVGTRLHTFVCIEYINCYCCSILLYL